MRQFTLTVTEQDLAILDRIVKNTTAPYNLVIQFQQRINAQLAEQQKPAPTNNSEDEK